MNESKLMNKIKLKWALWKRASDKVRLHWICCQQHLKWAFNIFKVCALVTNDAYFAIKIGDNMQQSKVGIAELTLNINLTVCKMYKTVTT